MKLPISAVCRIELEKRIAKWIEDTREERMKTAAWVIRTISSATKPNQSRRFIKIYPRDTSSSLGVGRDRLD